MTLLHFNGMVVGDDVLPPVGFTKWQVGDSLAEAGASGSRTAATAGEIADGACTITADDYYSSLTSTARLNGINLQTGVRTRLFAGFGIRRFYYNSSYVGHLFSLWDGTTCIVWVGEVGGATTDDVEVRLGGQTGTVIATISNATHPLMNTQWWYVEVDLTCDPVNGDIKIRLNGTDTVVDVAGINTGSQVDGLTFGHGGVGISAGAVAVDDLYVCDDTGTSYNTWLGPVRISERDPTSLTAVTGWTDQGGAALALSDLDDYETTSANTSYAMTATDGASFTTGYSASISAAQVAAVQVNYLCQDVGDATSILSTTLTENSVESAPVSISPPAAMGGRHARFDLAPDGTPWTAAKANGITVKTVGNL